MGLLVLLFAGLVMRRGPRAVTNRAAAPVLTEAEKSLAQVLGRRVAALAVQLARR